MREGMKPIPSRPPPLKEEELFFLKGHSPLSLTPNHSALPPSLNSLIPSFLP